MKKVDNLSNAVKKFEEEQAMVSLKKKGQLLGFWNSLPYKPVEENIIQCQGQAELGLISTADGRVFHRLPNDLYCHQFRMIYKVGLGLHFASKKICFSSTDKYIGRIKVTLQEPQSIDQLVVPHRTVISYWKTPHPLEHSLLSTYADSIVYENCYNAGVIMHVSV